MNWRVDSWQKKSNSQVVNYHNQLALEHSLATLSNAEQIVSPLEIEKLKSLLMLASAKKLFILHAGECAETFDSLTRQAVDNANLLIELQQQLGKGLDLAVLSIGRIAGQFAKPRTNLFEYSEDEWIQAYRGDLINLRKPDLNARLPQASYLLQGYKLAQSSYNAIRSQLPEQRSIEEFSYPSIFCSHEALNLYYEQGLTRKHHEQWYNVSTHLPWLGVRTSGLNGAHVEYLKGISNPIGIKTSPSQDVNQVKQLIDTLNPLNLQGKIVLISRMGKDHVAHLHSIIEMIEKLNKQVVWLCDPMHGNTLDDDKGYKIRFLDDIKEEISKTFQVHAQHSSHLSGIHLELTSSKVNECRNIDEESYENTAIVDPRLNKIQSKDLIDFISTQYNKYYQT